MAQEYLKDGQDFLREDNDLLTVDLSSAPSGTHPLTKGSGGNLEVYVDGDGKPYTVTK